MRRRPARVARAAPPGDEMRPNALSLDCRVTHSLGWRARGGRAANGAPLRAMLNVNVNTDTDRHGAKFLVVSLKGTAR